jgi:hypothetical protein
MILGMTNSPYGALYNNEVPGDHRSTMLSFQSLVAQIGGLLGSVLLEFMAGEGGFRRHGCWVGWWYHLRSGSCTSEP